MTMLVKVERPAILGSRKKSFENLHYFWNFMPQLVETLFECDTRAVGAVMGPTAKALGTALPLARSLGRGHAADWQNGLLRMREVRSDLLQVVGIERSTHVPDIIKGIHAVDRANHLPWVMHVENGGPNNSDLQAENQLVGLARKMGVRSILFLQLPWGPAETTASMTQTTCGSLAARLPEVNMGVMTILPTQLAQLAKVIHNGGLSLPADCRIDAREKVGERVSWAA